MNLSRDAVARALDRVAPGLLKYEDLQRRLYATNVAADRGFQRAFNGYYRVRRDGDWQAVFYEMLEREKTARNGFELTLRDLHGRLGRFEASFASKLTSSVDPSLPVIDAFVLANLGLRLPAPTSRDRLKRIVETYREIRRKYSVLVASGEGRSAIAAFDRAFPGTELHDVKKLDLILWQSR